MGTYDVLYYPRSSASEVWKRYCSPRISLLRRTNSDVVRSSNFCLFYVEVTRRTLDVNGQCSFVILFERLVNDLNSNPSMMKDSSISSLLNAILWDDSLTVFFIIGGISTCRSSSYSRMYFEISKSERVINDFSSRDPVLTYTILSNFCIWIDLQDHTMNLAVIRFLFFAQKFQFCNIENVFWKSWSINLTTSPCCWWFNIISSLSLRGTQIKPICVQIPISNCQECFSTHFLEMMKAVSLLSTDHVL